MVFYCVKVTSFLAVVDLNSFGLVFSSSEMKLSMKKINERVTDAEIDNIIKEADLDEDGEVNFPEFCAIMSNN